MKNYTTSRQVGKELCDRMEKQLGIHLGVADRVQILGLARKHGISLELENKSDILLLYVPYLSNPQNYSSETLFAWLRFVKVMETETADEYLERYRVGEFSNGKWGKGNPWP
jgi:hypothetical protein